MEEYAKEAMSETGDVGPKGSKLLEVWCAQGRVMLIPCLPENPDQVVGAVDVKKGPSYDQDEPESTEASIWRKRVDQIVRRRGLGHTLMQAADDYARTTLNSKIMGLWMGNPIAGDFYVKKAGFVLVPGQLYWYDAFKPHPSILRYTKEV